MKKGVLIITIFVIYLVLSSCNCHHQGLDIEPILNPVISGICPAGVINTHEGFDITINVNGTLSQGVRVFWGDQELEGVYLGRFKNQVYTSVTREMIGQFDQRLDHVVQVRVVEPESYSHLGTMPPLNCFINYRNFPIKKNPYPQVPNRILFWDWFHSSSPVLESPGDGELVLAWKDLDNGRYQAMASKSLDGGETWSQVLNISRSERDIDKLDLGCDDEGHYYMVWDEKMDAGREVYFSRSLDGGETWFFPTRLNDDGAWGQSPTLEVLESGEIVMTYLAPQAVIMRLSRDRGTSWDRRVIQEFSVDNPHTFKLSVGAGGRLFLLQGESSVLTLYRFNGDFTAWERVFTRDLAFADLSEPVFLSEGQRNYLFWTVDGYHRDYPGEYAYLAWSDDAGDSWSDEIPLHDIYTPAVGGKGIGASENGLGMIQKASPSPFLTQSSDRGETWSYPMFLPGMENHTHGYNLKRDRDGTMVFIYCETHPTGESSALKIMTFR